MLILGIALGATRLDGGARGTMRDLFDIFRIGPTGASWCEEAPDAATAMKRAAARSAAEHCEYLVVSEATGEKISLPYKPKQITDASARSWVEKHERLVATL